jgi:hypothetical protein
MKLAYFFRTQFVLFEQNAIDELFNSEVPRMCDLYL